MNQLWKLAIICSIGSICVVLGIILTLPVIIQGLLLIVGLAVSIYGLVRVSKYLLNDQH